MHDEMMRKSFFWQVRADELRKTLEKVVDAGLKGGFLDLGVGRGNGEDLQTM